MAMPAKHRHRLSSSMQPDSRAYAEQGASFRQHRHRRHQEEGWRLRR